MDSREIMKIALMKIIEVGTRTITDRIGDMYDPDGYVDNEIISDEALIAMEALGSIIETES